jgi:hypothetical protein
LLGISLGCAVLDVETDHALLMSCLQMLEQPHLGVVHTQMGRFGTYPVTLNLNHDDSVSVVIDGPAFVTNRDQCAAIWVEKEPLRKILEDITRMPNQALERTDSAVHATGAFDLYFPPRRSLSLVR